jgi:tetratricopeptide (TPR) repeat protein
MADDTIGASLAALFQSGQWADARKLLESELVKEPDNHWLLTQLGVTYYEQQQYEEALKNFQAASRITPDCPLVLWNTAGALDALGKHAKAIQVFTRLLKCDVEPEADACWESPEWSAALKADCVYRLGSCFRDIGKKEPAEECFRQYLDLLLSGIDGSYSFQDVSREIRGLSTANGDGSASHFRKAIRAALRTTETKAKNVAHRLPIKNRRSKKSTRKTR